jgi:hypothetical protein
MADHSKAVASLIRAAEQAFAAAKEDDLVAYLAVLLRLFIWTEADPHLLVGALAEGVAATIAERIPAERQGETSREIVQVLLDRLRAHGVAPPDL